WGWAQAHTMSHGSLPPRYERYDPDDALRTHGTCWGWAQAHVMSHGSLPPRSTRQLAVEVSSRLRRIRQNRSVNGAQEQLQQASRFETRPRVMPTCDMLPATFQA